MKQPPTTARRLLWWLVVAVVAALVIVPAQSDPQTNLLNKGCSQYNATNKSDFFGNLNATFLDLSSQLSSGENKRFATAQQARTSDPVYAMIQCRDYLSKGECLSCFNAAVSQIRNCSAANGARVVYDGCFLRYESNGFYDQTTLPGNVGICSNRTASQPTAFEAAVQQLLTNLEVATPNINGYFAAAKKQVGVGSDVYAVAQCAQTVTKTGCQDCLKVAYSNIQSCPPDADARAVDAGCFLRFSDTAFFSDNQTTDITPFLAKGSSSKKKAIIGGAVGGGGGLILIIIGAFALWLRRSRRAKLAPRGDLLGGTQLQGPVLYSYSDLKSATKNFSEENKLGEGGFGDVYKGVLKNGNVVAVKKLALGTGRAKADFETEVKLISNVHHRNLVRLLGCCSKGPELLLVYDYMANGSLDKFIYGEKRGTLSWKQRFDMIYGIARGLAYLHDQYHVTIIHRDVKSNNILVDDDFHPKIADFGLARLLPEDQTHLTTRFAGTLGYTAPEYAIHGQLSEKVDTYAFGVVVLEIISGQRCSEIKYEPVTEYLLEKAWKLYENGAHIELVDESIDPTEYSVEDAKKVIEIALMCTQSPVSLRPTMTEVVVHLLSEPSMDLRRPSRTGLSDTEKRFRGDISTSTGSSNSNATNSFTQFTGR